MKLTYRREKIYDPFLRILHGCIGVATLVLILTGLLAKFFELGALRDGIWHFHIGAGYILIGGMISRVVWGFIGPRYAKWNDLIPSLKVSEILKNLKEKKQKKFGHNPSAKIVYMSAYLLLFAMTLTGLALSAIEHDTGPLQTWLGDNQNWKYFFSLPHEWSSYLVVFFVVVHLSAIVIHEKLEQRPIAQEMISGYQYLQVDQEEEKINAEIE